MNEPTLDDLLNEPIIRKAMVADGYCAEDIRLLIRQAYARANADGNQRSFPVARTARQGARRPQMTASSYQPSA
jgi:hypothetical protein